jgi:ankyrin repeat protein
MRMLLDAEADPNAANAFGATPLMWCAGDASKVRLLLAKGANVNARSRLGSTPLLMAADVTGPSKSRAC